MTHAHQAQTLAPSVDPRNLAQQWADLLASEGASGVAQALAEALQGVQQ